MNILDKPQRYRDSLLFVWYLICLSRNCFIGLNPSGTWGSWVSSRRWSALQRYCDGARVYHDFFFRDAYYDGGFRKLTCSPYSECPRHGVPSNKQHKVLAPTACFIPSAYVRTCRKRCGDRMDCVPSSFNSRSSRKSRWPGDLFTALSGREKNFGISKLYYNYW